MQKLSIFAPNLQENNKNIKHLMLKQRKIYYIRNK